jgi:glycosyltransferase A (GT-A) superfamily protein (DUF2064 family)
MTHQVMVMAKAPLPGRVKTRLCPPCSSEQAALIAAAALADTLDAVAGCGARRTVLALDGEPGPWLPAGIEVIPQRGHGLAERLANAWTDSGGTGLQIGMDTPQVGSTELDGLLGELDRPGRRAVLGHAVDGGWWVVGMSGVGSGVLRQAFVGVPMSTSRTGVCQERRLRSLGFSVAHAAVRRDIDTVDDLVAVAAAAPDLRTAELAHRLGLADMAA